MSGNVMAIGQKGKKMTDKAPEQVFGQPNKMTLAHVIQERDATFKTMLEHRQALEAERDELQEVVRSIRFLRTVERERYEAERYKLLEALTPSADTSEFGMDVIAARAKLGETEK